MTHHPNETPEPLAGPSVESCATALAEALRREKGWLLDYGHSVIRDAIDRKHLEPLAQEQAGEMPEPIRASMVCEDCGGTGHTGEPAQYMGEFQPPEHEECGSCNGSGRWSGDFYTAEQMREYRTAALQAKDAEIAGLKADAGRLDWLDSLNQRLNAHYQTTYQWKLVLSPNVVRLMSGRFDIDLHDSDAKGVASCRAAIDAAKKGEAA